MKLNFDIPTPESCMKCRFAHFGTDKRYDGDYLYTCLIDPNIKTPLKEAMARRNDHCPGSDQND